MDGRDGFMSLSGCIAEFLLSMRLLVEREKLELRDDGARELGRQSKMSRIRST